MEAQKKHYTEKQVERACKAFNAACKAASKCRERKRLVSCYSCPLEKVCDIQDRVNKNLAIKRGEVYIKSL